MEFRKATRPHGSGLVELLFSDCYVSIVDVGDVFVRRSVFVQPGFEGVEAGGSDD